MFNHTIDSALPMDVQAALVLAGLIASAVIIGIAAIFIFNLACCLSCEGCEMPSLSCGCSCEDSCLYLTFASVFYSLCPCCCKNWRERLKRMIKRREEMLIEEEEFEEQKRIARKFIDALKRKTKKKHLLRDLLKVNVNEQAMEWVEENVILHCENEEEERLVRERVEQEVKEKKN